MQAKEDLKWFAVGALPSLEGSIYRTLTRAAVPPSPWSWV
jgi:hypothetical protein